MSETQERRIRIDDQNDIVVKPCEWGKPGDLDIAESFRGHLRNNFDTIRYDQRDDVARAIVRGSARVVSSDDLRTVIANVSRPNRKVAKVESALFRLQRELDEGCNEY